MMTLLPAFFLAAALQAAPLRVLLVTGGHVHDISLYEAFLANRDWKVTVDGHPNAFKPGIVKNYDVLVLYDMADATPAEQTNLRRYIEAGKGLVVLHHALVDQQDWAWWFEEVVGARYVNKVSTFQHDVEVDVRPATKHAVLDGIEPFRIHDEVYQKQTFSDRIQVLLTTDHKQSDRAVAWIGPSRQSRVVAIQLGHGPEAHSNPAFRRLLKNAVEWSATAHENK